MANVKHHIQMQTTGEDGQVYDVMKRDFEVDSDSNFSMTQETSVEPVNHGDSTVGNLIGRMVTITIRYMTKPKYIPTMSVSTLEPLRKGVLGSAKKKKAKKPKKTPPVESANVKTESDSLLGKLQKMAKPKGRVILRNKTK